jgi:E3 ubiquitin-protein ligase NEDD4
LFIFHALGRIMGKALFDGQLVSCHMAQHLYKHILAWPITFGDLKQVDEEYYRSLTQLADLDKKGENLADILCMTFTTTKEAFDCKEEIELVEGGADTDVTNENYPEYLEACLKYRMLDQVQPQLMQLLVGFLEVIPEPLLTIFDFQELELLMCGLPTIDIDDWRQNTEYSGTFEDTGGYHEVCEWFWEVVSEFEDEMKARVLQFVTGTSGVPAAGFGILQGNDGNICEFTIHGVPLGGSCPYPRAQ